MQFKNYPLGRVYLPAAGTTWLERMALQSNLKPVVIFLAFAGAIAGVCTVLHSSGVIGVFWFLPSGALLALALARWAFEVFLEKKLRRMRRDHFFRFPAMQDETPSFEVLNLYLALSRGKMSSEDDLRIEGWLASNWADDDDLRVDQEFMDTRRYEVAYFHALQARFFSFIELELERIPNGFVSACETMLREYRDDAIFWKEQERGDHHQLVENDDNEIAYLRSLIEPEREVNES